MAARQPEEPTPRFGHFATSVVGQLQTYVYSGYSDDNQNTLYTFLQKEEV